MSDDGKPRTVAETLARVDDAWSEFRRLASEFPVEHLDEQLSGGWTRKQMLAHIAAWHDLTRDRLADFMRDGQKHALAEGDDEINGRVARAAAGRTLGEVLDSLESSFRRLRRQLGYLTDEQLLQHDGWAAAVIEANTCGHYAEHTADLQAPEG